MSGQGLLSRCRRAFARLVGTESSELPSPSPTLPAPSLPPPPPPPADALPPEPAIPLAGGRKPAFMSAQSYADRQIEEAMKQGLFDNLPLKGKPLPDLHPDDPNWWLRKKLDEEGLDMPLPPALELQRDVRREVEQLGALRDERRLRERLEQLNARIRKTNARHVSGPPTDVAPLDVEEFVRKWRAGRSRPGGE